MSYQVFVGQAEGVWSKPPDPKVLPPLPAGVRHVDLGDLPELEDPSSLRAAVTLESLSIWRVRPEALGPLFAAASELPALADLVLGVSVWPALPDSFTGLSGLLRLEVYGARGDLGPLIERLVPLTGLRVLVLHSGNDDKTTVPPSIASLGQLRELRIDGHVAELPEEIGALSALEVLALGTPTRKRLRLRRLPSSLGRLTALRELHLRGHAVEALPAGFEDLRELRHLDLLGNPLSALPPGLVELSKLEELDVSWCDRLTSLPEGFGRLSSLVRLRAEGTKLTSLPADFAALRLQACTLPPDLLPSVELAPPETTYVDELTVDRPYQEALPDDLGDPRRLVLRMPLACGSAAALGRLVRLERLTLATARLDLAEAFRHLAAAAHLEVLSLSGRHARLPAEIGGLVHLRRLWLSDNALTTLPDEIGALTALEELVLDRNPLTSLPPTVATLTSLHTLSLQSVARVPVGIGHLPALTHLALSDLDDAPLPPDLGRLATLETLELHGCRTRDLGALSGLARLGRLTLSYHRSPPDLAGLCRALASAPLTALTLDVDLDELPPEVGLLTSLRSLHLAGVARFPPEMARLEALSSVRFHDFSVDSAALKRVLPKGRWRKSGRSSRATYTRD